MGVEGTDQPQATQVAAPPAPAGHGAGACENCAAPLHGEYCHACGQSTHSPVRSFGHAVEEVFESFWHLDGRVFRTLRELWVPGRVALNYLAGHRVRYIAPLRLFVVLSVLTFFFAQLVIRVDATPEQAAEFIQVEPPARADGAASGSTRFVAAASVVEVERLRLRELAELQRALDAVPSMIVVARRGIEREIEALNRGADARIAELAAAQTLSDADIAAAKAQAAAAVPAADHAGDDARDAFEDALAKVGTLADVERLRAARLAAQQARLDAMPATATLERKRALRDMRRTNEQAACRVAQLQIAQARASEGPRRRKPAEDAAIYGDPECVVEVRLAGGDAEPWDEETNPVRLPRAPAFVERWVNRQIAHGRENVGRMQKDPSLYVRALLAAVPSALFLLVPVFALLLKLAYLGSGRKYLEHVVVALYSHAWLVMAILVLLALSAVDRAVAPSWSPMAWIVGALQLALWLWLPIYLLLMQKRVYGDGWWLTGLRYFIIGICYFMLLGVVAVMFALASLVRM
ncbi:MAG: DUF3667 domain-containing protein [Pseudomonas sp.]|nr:DUF3667 domain-containing protein [Pseudomonas sp.]